MTIGGKPAYLFSSRNPKTVSRHFRWMKEYGLDGVLVQRFVGEIRAQARGRRRGAQEHHGRRQGIGPHVRHRVRHLGRQSRNVRADVEGRLDVPGGRTEGHVAPELSAPQRQAGALRLGHGSERRQRPSAGRSAGREGSDRVVQIQGAGAVSRHLYGWHSRALGNADRRFAQRPGVGRGLCGDGCRAALERRAATARSKRSTAGRTTCWFRM